MFGALIERRWVSVIYPPTQVSNKGETKFIEYEDDAKTPQIIPEIDNPINRLGHGIDQQPAYDQLINT